MKTRWIILFVILIILPPPLVFSQCIKNDDWEKAPCLDVIANGRYNQEDVNMWAEYYSYKGTEFMEKKRSELNQAIEEEILQEWVDESDQNRNIYEYYFFLEERQIQENTMQSLTNL